MAVLIAFPSVFASPSMKSVSVNIEEGNFAELKTLEFQSAQDYELDGFIRNDKSSQGDLNYRIVLSYKEDENSQSQQRTIKEGMLKPGEEISLAEKELLGDNLNLMIITLRSEQENCKGHGKVILVKKKDK